MPPTQILTLEQAYARYPGRVASLDLTEGDAPFTPNRMRKLARQGYPLSNYVALYAVDKRVVMSHVGVQRVDWTSREGTEKVSAIVDVLTRPEGLRNGYAKRVFDEVHAREKRAGMRLSFLWTHRTWGAHRLYERLGYQDVFSHPSALKEVGARVRGIGGGYRAVAAKRSDWKLLEAILRESTTDRLGATPRFRGSFKIAFETGWRTPKNYRLIDFKGKTVGYVHVSKDSRQINANEGVVVAEEHLGPLLDYLEGLSREVPLTLTLTTLVNDAWDMLVERGYSMNSASHSVLMAKPLTKDVAWEEVRSVCNDPRFTCHAADRF